MGELGVARQQYEEVIQAQTTTFGPSHQETLLVSAHLLSFMSRLLGSVFSI